MTALCGPASGEFMGRSYGFWAELERQKGNLDDHSLMEELVKLRAKKSFYESRIKAMAKVMARDTVAITL